MRHIVLAVPHVRPGATCDGCSLAGLGRSAPKAAMSLGLPRCRLRPCMDFTFVTITPWAEPIQHGKVPDISMPSAAGNTNALSAVSPEIFHSGRAAIRYIEACRDGYDQVQRWHHVKALPTAAKCADPLDVMVTNQRLTLPPQITVGAGEAKPCAAGALREQSSA